MTLPNPTCSASGDPKVSRMAEFLEIDLSSLELFALKTKAAPELFQREMADAFDNATNEMLGLARAYPEYPGEGYLTLGGTLPGGFYTERQRRFFFAALANGDITVPYKRTFGLRDSWERTLESTASGFIAHLRTGDPVANIVEDAERQASMFQDYWEPVQESLDNALDFFRELILQGAEEAVKKSI